MTVETKVAFLVAGAQKSGTTALDAYLREHPELCMAKHKEPHFFDSDWLFASGTVNYTVYHGLFDPKPPQRLLGEATPVYIYWPQAVERIARYNPEMRFIILLRNPVTRAFSQWNYSRSMGAEPLPFFDALRAEPERRQRLPLNRAKRYAYVDRGYYARQLKRLWALFPVEHTLLFKSEQLLQEPAAVLAKIAQFLGIAPFPPLTAKISNTREYNATMSEEEKRYLIEVFKSEIAELERLTGWDCSSWLQ